MLNSQLDRIEAKLDGLLAEQAARTPRDDELLTVAEAAKRYKLAKITLYRWKDVQVKLGTAVRISRNAMDRKTTRP